MGFKLHVKQNEQNELKVEKEVFPKCQYSHLIFYFMCLLVYVSRTLTGGERYRQQPTLI